MTAASITSGCAFPDSDRPDDSNEEGRREQCGRGAGFLDGAKECLGSEVRKVGVRAAGEGMFAALRVLFRNVDLIRRQELESRIRRFRRSEG